MNSIQATRLKILAEATRREIDGENVSDFFFQLLKIELGGVKGTRIGVLKYAAERIEKIEASSLMVNT